MHWPILGILKNSIGVGASFPASPNEHRRLGLSHHVFRHLQPGVQVMSGSSANDVCRDYFTTLRSSLACVAALVLDFSYHSVLCECALHSSRLQNLQTAHGSQGKAPRATFVRGCSAELTDPPQTLSGKAAAALDKELMSTCAFSIDQLMELAGLSVSQAGMAATQPTCLQEGLFLVPRRGSVGDF